MSNNSIFRNELAHKYENETPNDVLRRLSSNTSDTWGYNPTTHETKKDTSVESVMRKARNAAQLSAAKKAAANRDWYQRNKAWKEEYNKEYYQQNKDYWKKRYEEEQKYADKMRMKRDSDLDYANELYKHDWDLAGGRDSWDKLNLSINTHENLYRMAQARADAAKINYERAQEEFNWAKDTFGKTPVTSLWATGAKGIINAGKSAISSMKSGLSSLASSISSGFSKLKSLF